MKRTVTMDAADLLDDLQPGDLIHPPDWPGDAHDEIKEVRHAGGISNRIEIVTKRTSWLVGESDQVKIVRF